VSSELQYHKNVIRGDQYYPQEAGNLLKIKTIGMILTEISTVKK